MYLCIFLYAWICSCSMTSFCSTEHRFCRRILYTVYIPLLQIKKKSCKRFFKKQTFLKPKLFLLLLVHGLNKNLLLESYLLHPISNCIIYCWPFLHFLEAVKLSYSGRQLDWFKRFCKIIYYSYNREKMWTYVYIILYILCLVIFMHCQFSYFKNYDMFCLFLFQ